MISHCTSNKGLVINKQTLLINNSQKFFNMQYINRTYNQAAGDTKISCFLKLKKNWLYLKLKAKKQVLISKILCDLSDTKINTLISPTNFTWIII